MKNLEELIIEHYNYCEPINENKEKYYNDYVFTEEENVKTKELQDKFAEFFKNVHNLDMKEDCSTEGLRLIKYRNDLGYVLVYHVDRYCDVYSYGNNIEEAFNNALIDYETINVCRYVQFNEKELKDLFVKRFPDVKYNQSVFITEFSLNDFRKYYGDNIPEDIINFYDNYLKRVTQDIYKSSESFKYDYETSSLVLDKNDFKQL